MAPEQKMNFTDKIRSIENQPVAWNKPAVWENVAAHLIPEKRAYWLAFAATIALVLISLYFYYTPDNSRKEQLVENGRPEPMVRDNKEVIDIEEEISSDTNRNRKIPVAKQITESWAINRIDSNTELSASVESTFMSHTDSVHVNIQVEKVLQDQYSDNLVSTATTSKVEPIIGVMELRVADQSIRSKRKKIFQRMPADERTRSEEITTGVIIARLK